MRPAHGQKIIDRWKTLQILRSYCIYIIFHVSLTMSEYSKI